MICYPFVTDREDSIRIMPGTCAELEELYCTRTKCLPDMLVSSCPNQLCLLYVFTVRVIGTVQNCKHSSMKEGSPSP